MSINPDRCHCGELPTVHEGTLADSSTVQIKCGKCGNHGALLTYKKPSDRQLTIVTACDGWWFGLRMK